MAYISYFVISESRKIKTQAFDTVSRDTMTTSAFMDEEIKSVNTVMQNVAYSNLVKEHFLAYLNTPVSGGDNDYSEMQNIKVLTDLLTAIMGPSRPVDQIYLYSLCAFSRLPECFGDKFRGIAVHLFYPDAVAIYLSLDVSVCGA